MNKILRLPDVLAYTGLRRSTLYRMMSEGHFPKSVKLGYRSVGWLESDEQEWIDSRTTRNNTASYQMENA